MRRLSRSNRTALIRLAALLPKGSNERQSLLRMAMRRKAGDQPLRPFTKTDWYGLAGATRFPNGDPPLVGYLTTRNSPVPEHDTVELVVDSEGYSVSFLNEDGEAVVYSYDRSPANQTDGLKIGDMLFRSLKSGRIPAGFKMVHDERMYRQAAMEMALSVDLPSLQSSEWGASLERPLKAFLSDPAYDVYVLGGVGGGPYLKVKPAPGALEADFLPAIKRDFNSIVKKIVELYAAQGVRISPRDVASNAAARSRPLVRALGKVR